MNSEILKGVRILDFSRILAGPYATRMLADFGAEVIKVQSHKTANGAESNTGKYFSTWNRNKRSITLDLSFPEARELALRLVSICDVVVENFSPRVMANWGLNYNELKQTRPELIMLSMSGMGQTGPWQNYTAFGSTVQALGGLTSLTAYDRDNPMGSGYAHADVIAGLYGAFVILAALDYRDRTGLGRHIDLSEYEAVCTLMGTSLLEVSANHPEPAPGGNKSAYAAAAPHGCYKCLGEDSWCVVAVFSEAEWQALVQVLGNPDWAQKNRFAYMENRLAHVEELDRNLNQWTSKRDAQEVVALLQAAGVPAGTVQSAEDLAHDPHLQQRDWFVRLQHPVLGETVADGSPIRLSPGATSDWKPSPLLGEANRYVYMDLLRLSEQEFSTYVEKGIIA
ncbi:MAG: CoA transferase [Desulfobacterales bacterium]